MFPTTAIKLLQKGDTCIPRLDDGTVGIQKNSEVEMEARVRPEKPKEKILRLLSERSSSIRDDNNHGKRIFRFELRKINPWMQLTRISVASHNQTRQIHDCQEIWEPGQYLMRETEW